VGAGVATLEQQFTTLLSDRARIKED